MSTASRMTAYFAQGAFGLWMGFAALEVLIRKGLGPVAMPAALWIAGSGAVAMMAAHHLNRRRYGGPGWRGLGTALSAQLRCLAIAVPLAGTLVLPVHGTLYAALIVAQSGALVPILAGLAALALLVQAQSRAVPGGAVTSRGSCG